MDSNPSPKSGTSPPWICLFLGGIPTSVTEEQAFEALSRFAEVTDLVLVASKRKNKNRGYGFCKVRQQQLGRILAAKVMLHGRAVDVCVSKNTSTSDHEWNKKLSLQTRLSRVYLAASDFGIIPEQDAKKAISGLGKLDILRIKRMVVGACRSIWYGDAILQGESEHVQLQHSNYLKKVFLNGREYTFYIHLSELLNSIPSDNYEEIRCDPAMAELGIRRGLEMDLPLLDVNNSMGIAVNKRASGSLPLLCLPNSQDLHRRLELIHFQEKSLIQNILFFSERWLLQQGETEESKLRNSFKKSISRGKLILRKACG